DELHALLNLLSISLTDLDIGFRRVPVKATHMTISDGVNVILASVMLIFLVFVLVLLVFLVGGLVLIGLIAGGLILGSGLILASGCGILRSGLTLVTCGLALGAGRLLRGRLLCLRLRRRLILLFVVLRTRKC